MDGRSKQVFLSKDCIYGTWCVLREAGQAIASRLPIPDDLIGQLEDAEIDFPAGDPTRNRSYVAENS